MAELKKSISKKKLVARLIIFNVTALFRGSHRKCSARKAVLRNFAKFTGKHLCQSLIFNKAAGLRLATVLKKRLWHRCFPLNFAKFLRTPVLQNTSGGLFCLFDSQLLLYFACVNRRKQHCTRAIKIATCSKSDYKKLY